MVHDGAVVLERATNTRGSPANIGSGNSTASEVEGLMSNDDTSTTFPLWNVKRILAACRVEQRVWMQLIFLLLGIGLLIPWNAFISAKAYFESRLCHETNQTQIMVHDNGSKATEPPPRRNLVSTFALVYNLSSVVTLTLIIAFQSFRDRYRRRCRLHRQRHSGEESGRTTAVEYSDNPLTQQASNNDDHAASSSNNRYSNRRIDADDAAVDGAGIDALSDRQTEFASSDEQNASRHHGTTTSNSFWLVVLPLSLYVAVFWNQAIMIWMIRIRHFWQWTLLGLVVCGMASGLAGAGIAASAGLYEASLAMNPYLTGQSLGGVAVSVANFIAATGEDPSDFDRVHCHHERLLSDRHGELDGAGAATVGASCIPYRKVDWSMFLYFFLASIVIIAGLIGFSCIGRVSNSMNEYESIVPSARTCDSGDVNKDGEVELERDTLSTSRSAQDDADCLTILPSPPPLDDSLWTSHGNTKDKGDSTGSIVLVPVAPLHDQEHSVQHCMDDNSESCQSRTRGGTRNVVYTGTGRSDEVAALVWAKVQAPASCIFLTFLVTLALFPGWTSDLRSVHQCKSSLRLVNDLNVPFSFVLFNVGDLIGRLLAARNAWHESASLGPKLVVASIIRFLFFPIFYLCHGGGGGADNALYNSSHSRFYVPSDLYSYTVQVLFAISNGALLTTAFAYAPSQIPDQPEIQERMSKILSFAVAFGLLCGSFCSYPIVQLFGG